MKKRSARMLCVSYVCTYKRIRVRIRVRVHIPICVHIHTHIYIYIGSSDVAPQAADADRHPVAGVVAASDLLGRSGIVLVYVMRAYIYIYI